jgi:hypothetical protein
VYIPTKTDLFKYVHICQDLHLDMYIHMSICALGSSDFAKILEIAMFHVVLDWQMIYKTVLEKEFSFILWHSCVERGQRETKAD